MSFWRVVEEAYLVEQHRKKIEHPRRTKETSQNKYIYILISRHLNKKENERAQYLRGKEGEEGHRIYSFHS